MTQTDEPKPAEAAAESAPETQAPEVATTPASEPTGVSWVAIVAVILVVGAAIGGVVTWPQWKHLLTGTPQQTAKAPDLRVEIDVLRGRVAQLEAQAPPAAAASGQPADLDPLRNRLDKVETAVQTLQLQPQVPIRLADEVQALQSQVADLRKTSADAATVLRLADRLDKVEADLRDIQSRRSSAAALLLAVGQLREALNAGLPFDAELRAVRALSPQGDDAAQALDALRPRAAAGIPTRMVLAERFQRLAPDLVRAGVLPEKQGWWRDTLRQLAGILSIQREDGEAAGDGAAAVTARANKRLSAGDLAGAIEQMSSLQGAAAEAARPWIEDARARLAADQAVGTLTADVVAAMGAATAKGQ